MTQEIEFVRRVFYRDGEEVEVGRLAWNIERLRELWMVCRQTKWLHYFRGNGPGEILYKEFVGFCKLSNQRFWLAQWTIGVKGGLREPTGNFYYKNVMVSTEGTDYRLGIEDLWPDFVKWRVSAAEMHIDFYTYSECRCRVGFHSKCPFHYTTQN